MCGINPMGGLLTSKTGRAAALGGVAGALLSGSKKSSTKPTEVYTTPGIIPGPRDVTF